MARGRRPSVFHIAVPIALSAVIVAIVHGLWIGSSVLADSGTSLTFQSHVLPLLKRHCLKCHGVSRKEGGLQLHSAVRVWKGGESGPAVVRGDASHSLLWDRVQSDQMPPDNPLTAAEKKLLQDWIEQGAVGLPEDSSDADMMQKDEHRAFTRLQPVTPPTVQNSEGCRTELDRFIQSDLEKLGLQIGPEADRRTLIRRISYTLTGLPPTPAEIDTFINDPSENALEILIDYFLASPQYGVRWGRHWLDAAGYADSNGYFNADTDRPLAWRYRDYVIRSINADKPFDQFVREQLAGDEMSGFQREQHRDRATPEMLDLLIATHFLRNGQDGSGESDGNPDEVRIDRYTALESAQQIVASSLLGLTIQCAKCHDHKFEPLTQADFYQFQAVLFPAYNPDQWVTPNERFTFASLPGVVEAWQAQIRDAQSLVAEYKTEIQRWSAAHRVARAVQFADSFDVPQQLSQNWSQVIPGDDGPAGTTAVTLVTGEGSAEIPRPAAWSVGGSLKIVEGGAGGDKWLSTARRFDWTPDEVQQWIQVSFSLTDTRAVTGESSAERIAFGIALHDFDGSSSTPGGNLLIDGNPGGGAAVHRDYPGPQSGLLGTIGAVRYEAGSSFGVRVTHLPDGIYRLQHLVDGRPEGGHLDLKQEDLPDGSFGFAYCCGRSFQVDAVVVEASFPETSETADSDAVVKAVVTEYQAELLRRHEQLSALNENLATLQKDEPGRIAWITDTAPVPPDVFLLERGEYNHPGTKVLPAAIAVLNEESNPLTIESPEANFPSSGRRLAWARWVTRPNSRPASLMARVQVNRVWQQHFGTGIVSTSENLGMSGADPVNADLLDWLAGEFIRSGWSLKSLHRLILTSAVYRQSSRANTAGLQQDPYNRLWWRYPLRRLDAEAIRDTQLAVSGELDLTLEGPYIATTRSGTAEVIVPDNQPGAFRRSAYLQHRRSQGLSLLSVFDSPTMVVNCSRRAVTTMPLQSLSLLNSEFAVRRAQHFAKRVLNETAMSPDERIALAFVLATGRDCDEATLEDCTVFLAQQRQQHEKDSVADSEFRSWADFCQLLLASNACLYVE